MKNNFASSWLSPTFINKRLNTGNLWGKSFLGVMDGGECAIGNVRILKAPGHIAPPEGNHLKNGKNKNLVLNQ